MIMLLDLGTSTRIRLYLSCMKVLGLVQIFSKSDNLFRPVLKLQSTIDTLCYGTIPSNSFYFTLSGLAPPFTLFLFYFLGLVKSNDCLPQPVASAPRINGSHFIFQQQILYLALLILGLIVQSFLLLPQLWTSLLPLLFQELG